MDNLNIPFSEIQELLKIIEKKGLTIGEALPILRTFRDKHNLTDKQVLDIVKRKF